MYPLSYLAHLCQQVDRTYSVSLQYGVQVGEVPHWHLAVRLPLQDIRLSRTLERGDDRQATLNAALSLGEEIKQRTMREV